ncbi:unnamed protein product, partial [Mesorhabditis spiculigera]
MTKLTWEQFCARQNCDLTQKILRIGVPVGIIGVAAFVCYCAWKKSKREEESFDEPPIPKIPVDTTGTAKERVIRAMNRLNKDIVQLNTLIGSCELEILADETVDRTKTARVVRRKEAAQRQLYTKEHHRKNLVVMLDALLHSEVESMNEALTNLRPISPSRSNGTERRNGSANHRQEDAEERRRRDDELRAELAELLGEESRKNFEESKKEL